MCHAQQVTCFGQKNVSKYLAQAACHIVVAKLDKTYSHEEAFLMYGETSKSHYGFLLIVVINEDIGK